MKREYPQFKGENPIEKLEADGWELIHLIPEYDFIEQKTLIKIHGVGNSTGRLEVSNFQGIS